MGLNKEEQEILESVERGEWVPIDNMEEENKIFQVIAKAQLKKDKRINIRLADRDLSLLKTKAVQEGMPYQTLISSVLHKYATDQL